MSEEKNFFVHESSYVDEGVNIGNNSFILKEGGFSKIAVLTYPIKHRKTYDVLSLLKAHGYSDVKVFAIPFHYKKVKFPLIEHRPEMIYDVPEIMDICRNLNYDYHEGNLNDFSIESDRVVLIAGAGILPDEFIKTHVVINAHPGYIPNSRGLDSLKWAIVEMQPIGVTSHLLGEFVDAGEVIERRTIPVKPNDTFHAVAQRVYENEVSILVGAIKKLSSQQPMFISPENYILHKRMPQDIEKRLLEAFEAYKKAMIDEL